MKTIGLIGGITPESTIMYYRALNTMAQEHLGEPHSAKVLIHSFDFGIIKEHQKNGRWDLLDVLMSYAAKGLENAGADCILICANTMHLCIEATRKEISIPVIHIAEATSKEILNKGLKKVALLGTKYTMEKTFYTDILTSFGIETIIPNEEDREEIAERFEPKDDFSDEEGMDDVPSVDDIPEDSDMEGELPSDEELDEIMDKLESFVDAPIEETSDLPESEEIEEKRIEDIADLSVRHEEVSEMEEDVELDLDELKKEINKNVDDTLSKYFK